MRRALLHALPLPSARVPAGRIRLAAAAALLALLSTAGGCDDPRSSDAPAPIARATQADGADDARAGASTTGTAATPAEQGPLHAVFRSATGSFRVRLEHEAAPRLCANFVNLVRRGFFTRQQWIDFSPVVRQTGACKPGQEPSYSIPREFSPKLLFDEGGRLCASNTSDDDDTARAKPTRIFVTIKPQDRWNLKYAVFGTIVDGLEVARTLTEGELIAEVSIEGDPTPLLSRYARQVVEWNVALDAVGAPGGPGPDR
jgi:cyclophilin family peptidyl-prolyl cis-trans isomerase